MTNQVERHSKLSFPVHKFQAESPMELFQFLPGLRRFFQRVTIDPVPVKSVKFPGAINIKEFEGNPVSANKTEEGTPGSYFFNEPKDLVKFIKFVIFVYDPDSDYVTEYPDELRLRKEAAAIEAGWVREEISGEWPDWIKDIFELKDKVAVRYILDFLQVKKNNIWREIVLLQEELEHIYLSRATDFQSAIKNNYDISAKKRIEELSVLFKRFFAEHADLKKVTEKDLFPVSPENVFIEMNVPEELYKMRQVTDVS
jgi:hypothetical protein